MTKQGFRILLLGALFPVAIVIFPSTSWANNLNSNKYTNTAKIIVASKVYNKPEGRGVGKLKTYSLWNHGEQKLLVLQRKEFNQKRWVKVRLPFRPNDSSGWILENNTIINRNYWRIRVDVKKRKVSIFKKMRRVKTFKAVVGARKTPTPKGTFAIYEKVRQSDPKGFIGPIALHLTAHSNVLDNYGGGPGRVAIHGRSGASLADPLGTARSHGCIRINNKAIRYIAKRVPSGTPVIVS